MRFGQRHCYLGIALLGALALLVADLALTTTDPGDALGALALGLVTPDVALLGEATLWRSLWTTLAAALWGTALAVALGAVLALGFEWRAVRWLCAVLRSIHELLWALLLLPAFGTSLPTGMLAIALPAAGIFGKVFAEIRQEADPRPAEGLPAGTGRISRWCYGVLPVIAPACRHYIGYRFECALRASALLGFIGIHTIGFELESYLLQGEWSQASLLLIAFILLVTLCRWGLRPWSAALAWAVTGFGMQWGRAWERFSFDAFTGYLHELVPWALRREARSPEEEPLAARLARMLGDWRELALDQALPGLWNTLVLGIAAAAVATLLSLVLAPFGTRVLFGRVGGRVGDFALICLRNLPSYLLAYIAVLVCGPSMLPGIIALALHNSGILAHLASDQADRIPLRVDAPRRRLDRYVYELLPRISGTHLAFSFYRFEVMLRESAVIGIIGIATIGFHIDTAIQEHKPDEALVLVAAMSLLIIGVDALSQWLRRVARLRTTPDQWR